jgi:hypothetical protein
MTRKTKLAKNPKQNLGPLGWIGVSVGAAAGVGIVLAGLVFYRMTKM